MERESTIKKLKTIFSLGYLPSRGNETYRVITSKGIPAANLGNCLEHACFNLTNSLFKQYEFDYVDALAFKGLLDYNLTYDENARSMLKLVSSVGLKVKKRNLLKTVGKLPSITVMKTIIFCFKKKMEYGQER